MGRYYCGEISGKFWVAVQSSCDADCFGVKYTDMFNFHVCGCGIEKEDLEGYETSEKNIYCFNCYDSYEEHKQAILDDEVNADDDNTWYISTSEVSYQFDNTHIDAVESQIKILEADVSKYMDSYVILDENDEISYDYNCPENLSGSELILVARLCLGKQILYCLQKNDSCYFTAEL